MAYLPEQPEWTDGVYQLEKSDPVRGGVGGPANRPLIDLLKRTAWLKQRYEEAFSGLGWAELGEWAVGLEVTTPSQIVHYQGYWYRYGGSLPHTITGASPSLDDNDNWFNLGNDLSLRANLGSSEEGMGDTLLAVKQPYTGAVARTQHDKNWDSINLLDFVYATDVVDGFVDYGLGLNRAIAAMSSLGSTSVEHIPRRRINLPAGLLHIKTKVELSFGPFAMCGEGIFQTIFAIHPSAASDDDYLFDFSSAGWDSTGRVRISELYLSNFSVLGETASWIRKRIFKFYGVGWDFAIENVQVWSPPLSSFDMTDVMDGVFNQVRINSGGRFLTASSEVTHQINMLNQYDNCNAIRYMSCHFENNYSGVSYIRGGSNNILFGGMCKFENNSRNNLV
ncbi:TPA: hypothetical protein MAJ95_003168, partial [Klebsiella pneumoniae]|nr:hypothetical protein [Klebsiella pneumoniae]